MAAAGFELEGETTPLSLLARDLWGSRALLAMLARKEFFVRYRRASFGMLWAVFLPLFQAVVLAVVFSRVANIHTGKVNYVVFIFSGMVAWSFFASAVGGGGTAIVDGAGMSSKIYFPRAVLPLVVVAASVYGFAVSAVILLVMTIVSGVSLGTHTLLLVPAVITMVALSTAFALVFAALHVYFRDMRFIVQALLLAWFYVTPIIYPLTKVGHLATVLKANPVTGVVELFRAATVGADPGWVTTVWWTLGWTGALFVIALALYRRFNRVFVDLL
jgi:ABC-type polysaccharide/polyol phosphate export permease